MHDEIDPLRRLEAEAREILADRAERWMQRPNRFLDGLTPRELAQSSAGANLALAALHQQGTIYRLLAAAREP
jgi:uncharacterized protein (DUF2384 family)